MEKQRTTRVPKCGFCQNHGIKKPLKAHKRDCKYFDCQCRLCVNTRLRREHMADMQYIKRNGIVELERIQNGQQDVEAEKKDIYAKIYKERMANKYKKRSLKTGSQDALNLATETSTSSTGLNSAISPNSLTTESLLPSQIATLANLKAFTDTSNLDPQHALSNLHVSNRFNTTTGLFSNNTICSDSLTNDQFFKAAKLLGMGINPQQQTNITPIINTTNLFGNSSSLVNVNERIQFRNIEESDLNEINKFIDRLSIVNCLNSDDKILNRAVCILFNGIPLTLLDPGTTAEEIYSTFKQINTTNVFR